MARSVDELQMKLWALPISGININTKSRDDIPRTECVRGNETKCVIS